MITIRTNRRALRIQREGGNAVEGPRGPPRQRPRQAEIGNRPEVHTREAIALALDPPRHSDERREPALPPKEPNVPLGGSYLVAARSHGRSSRLDLPHRPPPVEREIGSRRRRVRVTARTHERGANLKVPQGRWRRRLGGHGGRCDERQDERESASHRPRELQRAYREALERFPHVLRSAWTPKRLYGSSSARVSSM
jgi:hypothetical protein